MNIEFDNIKTASAIPRTEAMIETFRAIGYTLETTVADIIDNSISASARNVWINLSNSVDSDWQIDIRKAKASPPVGCRQQLESYARQACNKGAEIYRHRGRILRQRAGQEFQSLWLEKKKDNKWSSLSIGNMRLSVIFESLLKRTWTRLLICC